MKRIITVILCWGICMGNTSCGQSTSNKQQTENQNFFEYNGETYALKKSITTSHANKPIRKEQSNIVFHEIQDPQMNMTMGSIPLPENWKLKKQADKNGAYIFGSNNTKVYLIQNNAFVYSNLQGYNQMESQRGMQIKPLKKAEQLVKEELAPAFAKDGVKLIRQYPLPELQKKDEDFDQFQFKWRPIQKEFNVLATEWEDQNGNALLFIIRQYASYTQEACYWGYYVNMMDAPKTHFENAKNTYLYALANSKYNPAWLQACYIRDAKQSAQITARHIGRMKDLIAEGEAIRKRGREHSNMVDDNHRKWMAAHLEKTTVTNGGSGQTYQVDAGNKEYWVNSSNEYISSDNLHYDPNMDNSVNQQNWTKATIQN